MGLLAGKSGVGFLLLIAIVVLGGCGNRGGSREEATPEPTVTPLGEEVAVIPTFTPTPVPLDPTPTAVPTSVPTPTPVPNRARINVVQANLRAGPGTAYALIGQLTENTNVRPVAQTSDRLWLKLDTGAWIFAELVDDIPLGLPVETNLPPTPTVTSTPVPPTVVPTTISPISTHTPVPVLGDWSEPIPRNERFLTPDFLEIRVKRIIYQDDAQMQSYIERRGGQSCEGCLVIAIEIVNLDGNTREYVMQEDFKLLEGSPDAEPYPQVRCAHPNGLRSMESPGNLQSSAFVKNLREGGERFLCFEKVPKLSQHTRLIYSPVFLYDAPTPTPTPRGSSVVRAAEPLENQQLYRTGWSVHFFLLGF